MVCIVQPFQVPNLGTECIIFFKTKYIINFQNRVPHRLLEQSTSSIFITKYLIFLQNKVPHQRLEQFKVPHQIVEHSASSSFRTKYLIFFQNKLPHQHFEQITSSHLEQSTSFSFRTNQSINFQNKVPHLLLEQIRASTFRTKYFIFVYNKESHLLLEQSSSSSSYGTTTTPCYATEGMDDPQRIPSHAIFTDDDQAKKNIDNIRPNSNTPLVIRKNEPVIRIVLPNIFVKSVSLPTNINVNTFRISVKRPSDDVLKPVQNGKVLVLVYTLQNISHSVSSGGTYSIYVYYRANFCN